ncbi:MAG: 16S rRNA (guanine(527)-N(7))-methyltransferase RsmG [Synergistaceae bacterium]|nr:16S rRNA (guanine(527)-N(7))-methyltransferase RsmG [Synergistaceae bacterium]
MDAANISGETATKLRMYASLLGDANSRARLTGPSDPNVLFDEHVSDALAGLPFLDDCESLVDVGTGGGLPGLVWAICRPEARCTLIDSVRKKADLVREMAEKLECQNVEVLCGRSEDLASRFRESFDIAAARALADSVVLTEYLSPFVRIGGRLLAFKGPRVEDELDVPARKWRILGLSAPILRPYSIAGKDRCLVVWEKVGECPNRYPRRPGMAEKQPWCGTKKQNRGY